MVVGIGADAAAKESIREWIRLYSLRYSQVIDGQLVVTPKTCQAAAGCSNKWIKFQCSSNSSCRWMISISLRSSNDEWRISQLVDVHSDMCSSLGKPTCNDLVKLYAIRISDKTTGVEFQKMVLADGLGTICKTVIYDSMSQIRSNASDPFVDGFSYLNSYLDVLRECNCGSIIESEFTVDSFGSKRFGRLMILMRSTINVVINCCKPILSFDAAFFKIPEWNKFQILIAGINIKYYFIHFSVMYYYCCLCFF
jgi:hypothetical protein